VSVAAGARGATGVVPREVWARRQLKLKPGGVHSLSPARCRPPGLRSRVEREWNCCSLFAFSLGWFFSLSSVAAGAYAQGVAKVGASSNVRADHDATCTVIRVLLINQ
jgi:hypothetical protein